MALFPMDKALDTLPVSLTKGANISTLYSYAFTYGDLIYVIGSWWGSTSGTSTVIATIHSGYRPTAQIIGTGVAINASSQCGSQGYVADTDGTIKIFTSGLSFGSGNFIIIYKYK